MSKHAERSKLARQLLKILAKAPSEVSYEDAWDDASLSLARGRVLLPLDVHQGFFDPDLIPLDFEYEAGCKAVAASLQSLVPDLDIKKSLDLPKGHFEETLAGKILQITVQVDEPLTREEEEYLERNLKRLPVGKVRYFREGAYTIQIEHESE